jgi:erythrocyte band 7 integral membrane protein
MNIVSPMHRDSESASRLHQPSEVEVQNAHLRDDVHQGMANPGSAAQYMKMQSFQLRKEPDALLHEMYEREGGQQSKEADEPCALGCMRCCGACCECCCNEQINEGYVGVVTEFGKFVKIVTTGAQSYNCCTQKIVPVAIAIQVYNLPVQRVLTKDGLQLSISAFAKYRVVHPQLYLYYHNSATSLMALTASGTLRSIIGQRTMRENLEGQDEIKHELATRIKHKVEEYGILVMDVEIQRMVMDVNLQRSLATVAESERQRKSKMIKASAALEASTSLKLAADELSKNPLSLQLKYFDVLKQITQKQSMLILRDTIVDEMKKKNIQK